MSVVYRRVVESGSAALYRYCSAALLLIQKDGDGIAPLLVGATATFEHRELIFWR